MSRRIKVEIGIGWIILAILLAFCFFGCATKPIFERGPLKDLVLRPRKGYQDRLTNKRCSKRKSHSDICLEYETREYDFNSEDVRKMLRELKFICDVRGSSYVPCPTARGLCQLKKIDGGWFKPPIIKLNKYLSLHDDYEFLIGADTYCASFDSDVGREMFSD